ncbi:hypothetical protein VARIO8X_130147 [Burkholderiales bacterium 8X]|nr:hypothetical protein VARIO8X_130147 [Burkholderiales bacterium 8X]
MTRPPVVSDSQDPIWAIFQHAPSMLGYFDRDLQCRFANRACERWLQVGPLEMIGSSLIDIVGAESFEANRHYIDAVLAGSSQTFEFASKDEAGTVQWRVACRPHSVLGKVTGFVVEVNDVTALHETQKALCAEMTLREHAFDIVRAREAALRQAQQLARIGSWEWEAGPDIVRWSEQLYDMFGLDLKRLPPSFLQQRKLYSADSWARLQDACGRALSKGQPYVLELQYIHSSGRRGWIESRGQADRDESGNIVGMHGTAMEITALRLAREADVEHAAATRLQAELSLERARSKSLETQLARSRKRETVGLLASGIANDFERVLSELTVALNLVAQEAQAAEDAQVVEKRSARASIERGQGSIERAGQLIRQLAKFSNEKLPESRVVDIGATLQGFAELLELSAGPLVQVHLEASTGLLALLDPDPLQVALLQLLIDARAAMPHGGEVFVGLSSAALSRLIADLNADERWAALTVRHAGGGWQAAGPGQARVREPSSGSRSGVDRQALGQGRGVAMMDAFARRSGGSMAISSDSAKGTTLTVLLPRVDLQPAAHPESARTPEAQVDPKRHGHARVLVADDDPLARAVVGQYLRELGYTVIEAQDAEHALQLANNIDLVVTDLGMPSVGGDGTSLAAGLRARHSRLPILMTTQGAPADPPADELVLARPFTLAQLADAVLRLLGRAAIPRHRPIGERIKHPSLRALYETWAKAKVGTALPSVESLGLSQGAALQNAFIADVTAAEPFAYRRRFTGAALSSRLAQARAEGWLKPGEEDAFSELEEAYRRCFSSGAPSYEFLRFRARDGDQVVFERLLLPCTDPRLSSHQLVGMVFFEDRAPDHSPGTPT